MCISLDAAVPLSGEMYFSIQSLHFLRCAIDSCTLSEAMQRFITSTQNPIHASLHMGKNYFQCSGLIMYEVHYVCAKSSYILLCNMQCVLSVAGFVLAFFRVFASHWVIFFFFRFSSINPKRKMLSSEQLLHDCVSSRENTKLHWLQCRPSASIACRLTARARLFRS